MIDARGRDGVGGGGAGANGVYPWPDRVFDGSGEDRPVGPGGDGQGGEPGAPAGTGGSVTIMCRRSVNARVTVAGGNGTPGGPGGNGARGVDGHITPDRVIFVVDDPDTIPPTGHDEFVPGQTIAGTQGGNGGWGGAGGNGGNGGTIVFTSIADDTTPVLEAGGGWAGAGGGGGAAGPDGYLSETAAVEGQPGTEGTPGAEGQITYTNVAEADYVAGLRPLLDSTGPSYANYWAPYRIVTGDYYYHAYNPSVPERAECARLAAVEFDRALELQPDNADALRLKRQLAGFPPGEGAVWVGGGINALGLPRELDVLPSFDEYITAFARFDQAVLDFLLLGVGAIVDGNLRDELAGIVTLERKEAIAARDNGIDDLELAKTEQRMADEEVGYAQQELDQATADIRKALEEMQQGDDPGFTFGDFVGTMAAVAGAVISVMAAIPTGGVSLVAVMPAMVALADSVLQDAEPIAKAVFTGSEADTEAVEEAYKKFDKHTSTIVGGAKSIINFVNVVEKLSQSRTPDNSAYLELVKRGTERTHQLLIARNRATLARQRVDAMQSRLIRAEGVVSEADALLGVVLADAASVKRAGLLAIAAAASKAEALLSLAFRAQRSVEIYTLRNAERHLFLDAGLVHPDISTDYYEEEIREGDLVAALVAAWEQMLAPLDIQGDYVSYFEQAHDQDMLRRSFTATDPQLAQLRTQHRLSFRIDASELPADRFDTKVKSVRLALVGASHPAGEVSCEIRHGGTYEQRRPDGTIATQLLKPRVSTRPAKLAPLAADEGLGEDPPLTAPRSLAFWGRGVGGDWELTIPQGQVDSGLDLSGLTEVQVWIGYQFIR